jgi:acetyl-CoA carboxylase carboxyl transferase subunit alpha
LLRDTTRAKDAAAMLKITSKEVLALKVVNGIIPEPVEGAHTNPQETANNIKQQILKDLKDLMKRNPSVLVNYRNKKIQSMGFFEEE